MWRESIELNTPEGYDVIFGMNYLFIPEENPLIHTTGTLAVDINSVWADVDYHCLGRPDGTNLFYDTIQIAYLDFPIAQIDIENFQ